MLKQSLYALTLSGSLCCAAQADPVLAEVCNAGACAAIPTPIALVVIIGGGLHTNIERNFQAAKNEPTAVGQLLRATTGVSIDDIGKYGLAGGPNSEINKIGRFFSNAFGW